MSSTATNPAPPAAPRLPGGIGMVLVVGALVAGAMAVLFRDGLSQMYSMWNEPEYNHGFMIPFVAVYLLWLRAREVSVTRLTGSWLGIAIVILSLAIAFLGDRSAVFPLIQYAFILMLWALAWAGGGPQAIRLLWVPLLYLVFMVPLPDFLGQKLTAGLQLISSQIGVAVIRVAGLSVFLEGNVIDLGSYKLQVAEACSGMRYLFPLLSFGYLCAVLFRGRWWQRGILLISTVPITILMNSFRIGVIGILVNKWGIEQAEGFLHDFEGWVVFMASVGVLMIEVFIFARMERRAFLEIFGLDVPPLSDFVALLKSFRLNVPLLAGVSVLLAAAVLSEVIPRPPTLLPERSRLATFPMRLGDFQGREGFVDQIYLDQLRLSDYMIASYNRSGDPAPVDIWIAYYDSQVKGASVHSPQACLPGGGWRIDSFTQEEIPDYLPDGGSLRVNRVEIALGEDRQVVYYWFAQRGRVLTNEFLVKWFIFWDGLTTNRTDGALVRLSTFVGDKALIPQAEARLQDFMRAAAPKLAYHLPDARAATRLATPEEVAALEFRPMRAASDE